MKYSLIRAFILYSLIASILTGVVLSIIISQHLKNDKFSHLTEVANLTIENIAKSNFSAQNFESGTTDSNKTKAILQKAFAIYQPKSIIIFDSKKNVVLSSGPLSERLSTAHYKNIEEMLSSHKQSIISKPYVNIDSEKSHKELLFDLYVPIEVDNQIIGVLVLQIPDAVITEHVNVLIRAIAMTLFGGLLILFLLLINILYNVSKTLINQNADLERQKSEIELSYAKLNSSYKDTVLALSSAVDARDAYTAGHSERVAKIALLIGKMMKLKEEELRTLEYAALFHDVGKLGIPDEILHKSTKLTSEEFEMIKKHPVIGINILRSIHFLSDELPVIRHHHEKFDGSGYPDKISGEAIPLGSRIIAIADAYDAMTTDRPYRTKLSHEKAVEEIHNCSGTQFDGKIVDAFLQIEQEIKNMNLSDYQI